jgi:MFS family permease
MLLAGLGVFGIASLLATFATSSEAMLLARFLSGVGAAMTMPVPLAVITSTFPPEERTKAIDTWSGPVGGGGILGMYLSAVLVDLASWRWLFALPVILVVLTEWVTIRSIPDSREASSERFDPIGALASLVAVTSIVFQL